METIPKSHCEKIGFFRKTHGVHGNVVLEYEPQFEYSLEDSERLFVELDGLLVPFFIAEDGLRFTSSKSAIVTFDWVTTEKYAKRLIGSSVYLYEEEIFDDPGENKLKLEGFLLHDEKLGKIGMINQVDDYAGNIVLTVNYRGNDVLIPYNEEITVELNETQKIVTLHLPDGILAD